MSSPSALPSVFDLHSLQSLKTQVKSDDPEALRTAARQFEALFLQMVLKSMRDAVPREGLFDGEQGRMYESLLDQQLSQVMAGKGSGLGLAAVIERQLQRQPDLEAFPDGLPFLRKQDPLPLNTPAASLPAKGAAGTGAVSSPGLPINAAAQWQAAPEHTRSFVERMLPYAQKAEQQTGIPARFMLAQAALETGWGRSEPRHADGRSSFNVFGIKADRSWQGASVQASTQEYVNGDLQQQSERFRSYASYAESFNDYARLLSQNPRYAQAAKSRDPVNFATALQQAGYATDPQYASKLQQIMTSPALAALRPLA